MSNFPKITELLPHRYPFLFVDEIESLIEDKRIECALNLDKEMPFYAGHFPNKPITPGVIITEALAQTSGILIAFDSIKNGKKTDLFFLASNNIKFIEPVYPNCKLKLVSEKVRAFNGLYSFSVEATANGKLIARGSLVLASSENAK